MTRQEMSFWIYLVNKLVNGLRRYQPNEPLELSPIQNAWEEAKEFQQNTDKTGV